MKSTQKISFSEAKKNNYEVVPKEENYLLNEIIEHILSTQHKSRIEWGKIKARSYQTARNYSRDFTSPKNAQFELEKDT